MNKIKAIAVSLAFFALVACGGGLTDSRDGKKYKTVKIGEQTWMAENLNIETGNSVCYDNNQENCQKYGRLYDWETAMKACPSGWHLPSDEEWDKLFRYVDGTSGTENPYKSETAGKDLKAKSGWKDNAECIKYKDDSILGDCEEYGEKKLGGTDKYGFAALPGGGIALLGILRSGVSNANPGEYGYWWTSSKTDMDAWALSLNMRYRSDYINKWNDKKQKTNALLSVRCIKDETNESKTDDSKADAVFKDAYCGEETEINETSRNAGTMMALSGVKVNFPAATICYQIKPDNKVEIKIDASSTGSAKLSGSYAKSGNKFSIDVINNEANKKSYVEFMKKYMHGYYDAMFDGICSVAENPKKCKKEAANSNEIKQAYKMLDNLAEMDDDKYSKYSGDFFLIGNSLHILNKNCQSYKSFTKKGAAASVAFDEGKQFCSNGTIYDKCGGKAYDLEEQKCENNIVLTKCGDGWYTNEQFCSNGVVKNYAFLTDPRDNKKYKAVKIGTQTWMAENLNYAGKNDDIGSCYNKEPKNCEKYGTLYTWEEAKKVCPAGWHLPSDDEWETLVNFAGGKEIAAKKLKAKSGLNSKCKYTTKETTGRGNVIEVEHDNCDTDEFGFSALPGSGVRSNIDGGWWTAMENCAYYANGQRMLYYDADIDRGFKYDHFSVRCVQD